MIQDDRAEFAPYLCWTRMQAEAGQALADIVRRKERERRIASGLFVWGVGNAPATAVAALAKLKIDVPVVFSTMKSKPKAIDSAPASIVAWTSYVDADGTTRTLPRGCLVTSRGADPGRRKDRHYALMCRADVPLQIANGTPFDHSAFVNVGGAGAPVGASQVTALLRQVAPFSADPEYEIGFSARLAEGYWTRLVDPVPLASETAAALGRFDGGDEEWISMVEESTRGRPIERDGILV